MTGGSSFLLSLCAVGFLSGSTSPAVLLEAERNIATKLAPEAMRHFHQQLSASSLDVVEVPPASVIQPYESVVFEDARVVASAVAAKAEYLLTLDRRLIARIQKAWYPIVGLTPRDFIEPVLPTHVEYPSLR